MRKLLQLVVRRNAYFLLAAAWLFTISFVINNYWTNFNSVSFLRNAVEKSLQKQEKDFEHTINNISLLQKLADNNYSVKELEVLAKKQYGLFLYKPDVYGLILLHFWNTQYSSPTSDMLNGTLQPGFVKLSGGQYEFLPRKVRLRDNQEVIVIGLIPIRKEYFIENTSLKKEFVNQPLAEGKFSIVQQTTEYPVKSLYGNTLFYLQVKPAFHQSNSNWLSLTIMLIGIVFLVIFINNLALSIAGRKRFIGSIFFLLTAILVLRSLTYFFPDLLKLNQYGLFDPRIYSSGYILPSLGDLLINSILFSWIVLFIRDVTLHRSFASVKDTRWHWPAFVSMILLLVSITFIGSDIIRSLIADARGVSFNVTNFFSLDVYSIIGFLVLAIISFSYFFLSKIILKYIEPLVAENTRILFLVIAVTGLSTLTVMQQFLPSIELNIYALMWLLIYVWLMQRKVFSEIYYKLNISVVIFWLTVFSVSISTIIIYENQKIELEQRIRTAEKLSTQADPSVERLISVALTYFDNTFLYSNYERFKIESSNAYLKDSLTHKNFSPFLNKYDTKIYTFDSAEKPLYNVESVSYDTLNTIYQIEGRETSVGDVRYFEKAYDKYSYIFKKVIRDTSGVTVGYFFVVSDPKRYKSEALVPELFKQNREFLPEYSPIYSYAVYNGLKLIDYYNNYQFPTHLKPEQVPKTRYSRVKNDGYDELWYQEGPDKVVIFAKKDNYLIEAITLFAWMFSTFLLLVTIFRIISLLIQSRLRWTIIKHYWQLNIRSQIHGTIIFISLFSFVVIGVASIVFFNNRYQRNNQDRLSKAIQIMANDIQIKIVKHEDFVDIQELVKTRFNEELKELLDDVSEIHGAEINLYDLKGNLLIASNPLIYSKGILSEMMNPIAFYYLRREQLVQYINQEQLGDIRYQSIYSPIRDDKGQAYAYLNIPSFISQAELKREISNFLVTIINLNAFIFLVAGVIALFITNRITSSFLLIGHKMREINLGKLNEEIAWHRDDEIGGLVKEYNKMVVELGNSALALAKSEREGAWREMARQVAHEIKNPLTPMKLSIQYLQKAINNDSVNVKELSSNVARTLIEQIDHLAKIAADFSQFANIGNVKNELFDLHEILYSLASLYESTENLIFNWHPLQQRILVMADKTQLNRLFTNLFQNALEACGNRETCIVTLSESIVGNDVIIKISDNGEGIPQAMQSKIFTPNFTTKSSGTGLGLAMSKTIIEQAKGRIWFETLEGAGTSFYVELPIIRTMVS